MVRIHSREQNFKRFEIMNEGISVKAPNQLKEEKFSEIANDVSKEILNELPWHDQIKCLKLIEQKLSDYWQERKAEAVKEADEKNGIVKEMHRAFGINELEKIVTPIV